MFVVYERWLGPWKRVLNVVDLLLQVSMVPFLQAVSFLLGNLVVTTADGPAYKALQFGILLPLAVVLVLVTFTSAFSSFVFWCLLSWCFKRNTFSTLSPKGLAALPKRHDRFVIVTSNLLLGGNFIGKFQNASNVWSRFLRIFACLTGSGDPKVLEPNYRILEDPKVTVEDKRTAAIVTQWPSEVDFLCLQEVWDRTSALALVWGLRKKNFQHFVFDINEDFANSRHVYRTSGLFFASRYPVKEVETFILPALSWHQEFVAHAIVMVKVEICPVKKTVGYLANVHLPAYEAGLEVRPTRSLTLLDEKFKFFRDSTLKTDENCLFAAVVGDFNVDNQSPCDEVDQDNPIYEKYVDHPRIRAGVDKDWSVGTEFRHLTLQEEAIQSAHSSATVLADDTQRMVYFLDGNLKTLTPSTCFKPTTRHEEGIDSDEFDRVYGGRRRVDKILFDPFMPYCFPSTYRFVTALATNTDHVPVMLCLTRD